MCVQHRLVRCQYNFGYQVLEVDWCVLQMSSPTQTTRDINIAVVGSAGVGKTTFIERAYDLSVSPSHGEVHYLTVMVDRSPCSVGLVEVDLNSISFEKQPMQWPRVSNRWMDVALVAGLMTMKGDRRSKNPLH
jgi:ABC-type cobalamin/Fe3+-siderophores transport system ATPase subunit